MHFILFYFSQLDSLDLFFVVRFRSVEQYGSATSGGFDVQALLSAVSHFFAMFCGSFAIGVVVGMMTALITKFTHVRDHPLLETTLFVLMSYTTFLLAETIGFTGKCCLLVLTVNIVRLLII